MAFEFLGLHRAGLVLQLAQSPNTPNMCDHCRRYMVGCRVIAGGPRDHKQFCCLACYDHWRADEHSAHSGHS
jgi:hypothetical protein